MHVITAQAPARPPATPWRASRDEFVQIGGLRYRLRHWGREDRPCLLLLHGWADVSATFQFIAEHLADRWHLVAPDWRGCGQSDWTGHTYHLADLVCDLDALVTHCFGTDAARVVGHSMGANVAYLLAGSCPGRISALAALDAYGSVSDPPDVLVTHIARTVARSRGDTPWVYPSLEEMTRRLTRANPRLSETQAQFMALELGEVLADGSVRMRIDRPWRDTLSQLLIAPLFREVFSRIKAPVLLVGAGESYVVDRIQQGGNDELALRLAALGNLRHVLLQDASHNVHHDQPGEVARLVDEFFAPVP